MQNSFDYSGDISLDYTGSVKDLFTFSIHTDIEFFYAGSVEIFVCDVLNRNYPTMVEKMECHFKFNADSLLSEETFERDRREELRKAIIKEFSELDLPLVEKIAWEVFCNTKYEALSTAEKFFACDRALCIATKEKNPFLQEIQVNISSKISKIVINHKEDKISIIPNDFAQAFEQICATLRDKYVGIGMQYTMRFSSIKDIFIYFFIEMVKQNSVIKKCPNCGRFFSPLRRSDANYCLYPSPQDPKKTCQQYVSYANYLRKTQTDMATKLHKQIYNIKANRAKRDPDNDELWEDVETFLVRSRRWKKDIKNGSADEAQYIEWLQKIKDNDA